MYGKGMKKAEGRLLSRLFPESGVVVSSPGSGIQDLQIFGRQQQGIDRQNYTLQRLKTQWQSI